MKVSVITPSYNRSNLIEDTIQSVLNQTYNDIEYIVVDGKSDDGTIDILEKYRKLKKLEYISEPDHGMYDAINKGIKLSSGEIIAYLNTDDLYFPWTVETAVNHIRDEAVGMVFGDTLVRDTATNSTKFNVYPHASGNHLRAGQIIPQPTVFFKRDVVTKIGFFGKDLSLLADCEYWLRAIEENIKIKKIFEIMAIENNHSGTLREKYYDEISKEKLFLLEKYKPKMIGGTFAKYFFLKIKYIEKEALTLFFILMAKYGKSFYGAFWSNFLTNYFVSCEFRQYIKNKIFRTKEPVYLTEKK